MSENTSIKINVQINGEDHKILEKVFNKKPGKIAGSIYSRIYKCFVKKEIPECKNSKPVSYSFELNGEMQEAIIMAMEKEGLTIPKLINKYIIHPMIHEAKERIKEAPDSEC